MFNYLFQHLVSKKDIRIFNGNYFYYILFRFFRYFISGEFKISIFNFYVYASASNKQTSHSLIKKCNFSDTHELATINKFNSQQKTNKTETGIPPKNKKQKQQMSPGNKKRNTNKKNK